MRTVYLLRHAKSSWDDPTLADHDRPLAQRGIRAARQMAGHMRDEGIAPDVLLCSSAVRTRETLDLLGDAVPVTCEVLVEDTLYHASADSLIDRLRALPDVNARVMLIGHNPALQYCGLLLAGSGARRDVMARKFPTAALATLAAPIDDWSALVAGSAELAGFVRPKDLDGSGPRA